MEKNNKILKIMVIIFAVLVVGLSGYIVYDKMLSDDGDEIENNNILDDNDEQVDSATDNDDLDELYDDFHIMKLAFYITYDYFATPNAYCESVYNTNEKIVVENSKIGGDENNPNGYYASEQFTSYDEMISFLKQYMSIDLINSKISIDRKYYLEKDGYLYCAHLNKGSVYDYFEYNLEGGDASTFVSENNITKDTKKVETIGTMILTDSNHSKESDKVNLIYEKIDGNWIITSYEPIK